MVVVHNILVIDISHELARDLYGLLKHDWKCGAEVVTIWNPTKETDEMRDENAMEGCVLCFSMRIIIVNRPLARERVFGKNVNVLRTKLMKIIIN